jgi:hypothetical protein
MTIARLRCAAEAHRSLTASGCLGSSASNNRRVGAMRQQVARVGKYGKSWHLLDSNGRVRCENHMSEAGDGISGPYLTQDANGQ